MAALTVIGPPVITKAFGAGSVTTGQTTSLTFTIANPNASVALNGVAFTDTLPTGLILSSPNGLNPLTGCNGTVPQAVAGTNLISLNGATLGMGASCTFSVNVTATALGTQTNVTSNVTSVNGGTGLPAMAVLVVTSLDSYQVRYAAHLDVGDSLMAIL